MAKYTLHIKSQTKEEAEKRYRMETRFDGNKPDYHRPYIRKSVRETVEANAEKNEKGEFLDCHTKEPIKGTYHLGHKNSHEYRYEAQTAKEEGLTQKEFNEKMNNPDLYQIESPEENMSHKHEMTQEEYEKQKAEKNNENQTAQQDDEVSTESDEENEENEESQEDEEEMSI